MNTNTHSSDTSNGILEQLEDYVKFKINLINGLMDLRTNEPDQKCKEAFEDVIKTFSEVDVLVDTLTDKVERDKSFLKYIHSILKSNESQMENLLKLAQTVNEKGGLPTYSTTDDKSEPSHQINVKNTNNPTSNIASNVKNYRSLQNSKLTTMDRSKSVITHSGIPRWKLK
ncbi:hypothetical protein MACK_001646 [Theileria orientalis]|uniref:Uncharacterized protein n=1 Tax=Theileria orientalis TaxID=68886 RepID=A0A976MDC5_THEOR|nr:hypothetical protein MACK_001646 [Theileria orientalis]